MKTLKVLITISTLLLISCAKERDVELKHDPENENIEKSLFTGSTNNSATYSITAADGSQREVKGAGKTWIYKATVVKTSSRGGFAFVGYQSDAKAGYFEFTKEKLKLYRAHNIFGIKTTNVTPSLINQWDIKHYDVMLAEKDGKTSNKEKEDDESTWDKKRFFNIDFADADVSEAAEFPYTVDIANKYQCWKKKASHLVDNSLELSGDYMSFVVSVDYQMNTLCNDDLSRYSNNDYTYTVHYKYSFKTLKKTSYKPFLYKDGERDSLVQTFGYFRTFHEKIGGKNGTRVNSVYMNRWDPNKDHHYFFTKDFPKKWKWIFNDRENGVFAKTNELFKKNGIKARFYIHDNDGIDGKTKEFGDIRYSFINFVQEQDPNAPLGYGPSDTNPFTGEIISGNITMWTGYLQYYLRRMADESSYRAKKQADSSLITHMSQSLGKDLSEWGQSMDFGKNKAGDIFLTQLQETTYANPYWSRNTIMRNRKKLFSPISTGKIDELVSGNRLESEIHQVNSNIEEMIEGDINGRKHNLGLSHIHSTVYPIENSLADAAKLLIEGESGEDIINTIMYRTAIHEFGHNLNLRHNFYGSVDQRNFGPDRVVTTEDGEETHKSITSSVMDYLSLYDEAHLHSDWEAYDKAALLFAYSDGEITPENGKTYLYCTDENRAINAMCNVFDNGSTPTQVLKSMIESYDSLYMVRNFRYDRGYWNTSSYAYRTFKTMWDVKKFLNMWRSNFTDARIKDAIKAKTELAYYDKDEITDAIESEMKQAQILSMAFYDGVIQQKVSDRDYRDNFARNGDMNRIGILYDKIFAMRFLVGDESFMYNPNREMYISSYLAQADDNVLKPHVDKYFANAITSRVDMEPWFLSYGRALFAKAATNYHNQKFSSYVGRIKISKIKAKDMSKYFGLKASDLEESNEIVLTKSSFPSFDAGETVGILSIGDDYYMTSKSNNPYAYNAFKKVHDDIGGEYSVEDDKLDFVEMFKMYSKATGL